jgi:hypothetical protein
LVIVTLAGFLLADASGQGGEKQPLAFQKGKKKQKKQRHPDIRRYPNPPHIH